MTQYVELCSFSIRHEYYGESKPPISLSVTKAGREILSSGNCLFKSIGKTARIFCETSDLNESDVDANTALQVLAKHQPEAVIEIHLNSEDSSHYNYTAPVFGFVENLAPADSNPNVDTDQVVNNTSTIQLTISPSEARAIQKVRLLDDEKKKSFDPEKADQDYATPVFEISRGEVSGHADLSPEYWNSYAQAVARPLCVIQLPVTELSGYLNELSRRLKEGGETPQPIEIITKFASQKVYWRYNLMSFTDEMNSDDELSRNPHILDRSGGFEFIRLPKAEIYGVVPARFISNQAIPLSERATQRFELRGQVNIGGRIREIRELLPSASASSLSKFKSPDKDFATVKKTNLSTTFVADIFIN